MVRPIRFARVLTATALGLSLLATGGCGLISGDGDSTEKLTVCTTLPYEPFQFKDKDKKIVGFDVDIIDLVAEKMGRKQEIKDTGFEPIKSGEAMANGTCDLAAAAITINDEREKVMDFSEPYYDSFQALAVLPDSEVNGLKDLKGKVVGAQGETTGEAYADEHAEEHGYTVKSFRNLGELRESLLNGDIDAAINDAPVWKYQIVKSPDTMEVREEYDTGEQYGYPVAKGDTETLKAINDVLAESKENGEYAKIYKKWFGEEYKG